MRKMVARFDTEGIESRPVIAGDVTLHPFWKKELPQTVCEQARTIHAQGFYFPNNPDLSDEEVNSMCSLIESGF